MAEGPLTGVSGLPAIGPIQTELLTIVRSELRPVPGDQELPKGAA